MARRPGVSVGSAVILAAIVLAAVPNSAAACSGGTDVRWAIGHTTGDVVIGRVTGVNTLWDYTTVLDVDVDVTVRGRSRESLHVRGAMGDACDQWAEVGRTVLVLYRIRGGDPPYTLPLFYIVGGAGGYPRAGIDAALAFLPDTATVTRGASEPATTLPLAAFLAALAGVLGTLAIRRRLEDRP